MHRIQRVLIFIMGLFTFVNIPLLAQPVTEIRTTKDCMVHEAMPNTNLNGTLIGTELNSGGDMASFVYFNLSSIPPNAAIESAALYLYCTNKIDVPLLRIGRLHNDPWTETGVTWNNMPYGEEPPAFTEFFVGPAHSWRGYMVTQYVQAWFSGTYENNGFQLYNTGNNPSGATFYAREGPSDSTPYLQVTYLVAPTLASPANNATNVSLSPMLSWNAPEGATSYHMQVSTDADFSTGSVVYDYPGLTGTSHTLEIVLMKNTDYYWHINAKDAVVTTPYSTTWKFTTTPLSVEENNVDIPNQYQLYQNYPNPFNPETKIKYSIPKESFVSVKIFNVHGHEMFTLVNEKKQPGEYEILWKSENVPSGVYYYQIMAGDFTQTKKMIMIK